MNYCQAYGCGAKATCHGVLCDKHYGLAGNAVRVQTTTARRLDDACGLHKTHCAYMDALSALIADVNRRLIPPEGAAAARPEPKGPSGAFAGSAFSTPPPRNRVEEI